MFVCEKALELVAIPDTGIAGSASIILGRIEMISFLAVPPLDILLKDNFNGSLSSIFIEDKDILQLSQINIFDRRLEKILQGIIERTFTTAIFAINEQVLALPFTAIL